VSREKYIVFQVISIANYLIFRNPIRINTGALRNEIQEQLQAAGIDHGRSIRDIFVMHRPYCWVKAHF
jgi:hypothetical protein